MVTHTGPWREEVVVRIFCTGFEISYLFSLFFVIDTYRFVVCVVSFVLAVLSFVIAVLDFVFNISINLVRILLVAFTILNQSISIRILICINFCTIFTPHCPEIR